MIDKIIIKETVKNCPHCEEPLIEETISQICSDDDFEEAFDYASEVAPLCKDCRADELSDWDRDE